MKKHRTAKYHPTQLLSKITELKMFHVVLTYFCPYTDFVPQKMAYHALFKGISPAVAGHFQLRNLRRRPEVGL
jgi:hypothetical protein